MSGNPSILRVNGVAHDVSRVPLHETVLDFLRRNGMTGTKCGCNEGDCGACSVLLLEPDGKPRSVNACLAFVHSFAGREIRTAEGIGTKDELHPVQAAMVSCNGSQCGYCTPGFIASMTEAWQRGTSPDEGISDQLCGNLCRCTGYRPIREAMHQALLEKEGRDAWETRMLPGDVSPAPSSSHLDGGLFLRPERISDVLAFKKQHPEALFVAGATEVAVLVNKRHLRPSVLISLDGVRELAVIRRHEDAWEIGGAARLTDIQDALGGEIPALDEMFRWFASRQIRHRATLGGNLATASPIGDSAPILMALDAVLLLVSPEGEREVALADFFTGYRKTVLRADELIRAIRIPRRPSGRVTFFKVSKRREMDISIVAAGIRIATDAAGLITEVRLAFGGVAEKPMRATAAEAALIGRPLAAHEDILDLLENTFTPLDDVRGSASYRRSVVKGLFEKFVTGESNGESKPIATFTGGHGIPHESAPGHVTGGARYVHDTALGRAMLDAWAIRSKVANGTIRRLDLSAVESSPGVSAVLTGSDIPGVNNSGPVRHDEPLLAEHEILFHGQAIALVVGESLEACRLAAEKAIVEIDELPPLLGIAQAIAAESFHTDPHVLGRGDVEVGLAESPHLLEGEFSFGGQEHFYLETHAAWAESDGEGGVHVASSTQHPSEIQTIVAEVLGLQRHDVVVESPRMGGGFGGKETQGNAIAALCALAAMKTGKPVRWQLDRDEDMSSTGKRHPFLARYRVGYDNQGMLHALDAKLFSDGGWSLDLSQPVTDRAIFHLDNAYYIPHERFEGRVAKTHTVSNTAFRGFGGPQGMLVIEEIIGRIALKLGLPAEEIRARNFYHGSGETNT
ncbi:MAG TPA: molybdopterin cofactor-binding domain-containing protein, partial [Haloferula sp.]